MRFALVCRYFPPAVSGGARRPFLLAQALERRGHEVVVVAPEACEGISVVQVPHVQIEPPAAAPAARPSPRDRLRDWVYLPDPDIRWALAAARVSLPSRPDWVISTSPPESSHLAGRLLKRRFACRWLADFRDHWVEHPLRPVLARSAGRRVLERSMARLLLAAADAASATTPAIRHEILRHAPKVRATVIENFAEPPKTALRLREDELHIVHTGSFILSDGGRPIEPVIRAFETAGRDDLRLHLVGRLRDDEAECVRRSPAASRIDVVGVVPLEEARAWQAAADVLLLVAGRTQVPGKLAEYRAAGRPMLVYGDGPWAEAAGLTPVTDLRAAFARLPGSAHPPGRGVSTNEAVGRFVDLMAEAPPAAAAAGLAAQL